MAEEKSIKRGKQNGYNSSVLNAKLDKRRDEAEDRQARYDRLSTTDKAKLAKSRRGESKRDLARLAKEKAPKPAPPTKEQREASKSAKAIKTAKSAASSVPNYT
jgi:hypothetical protein